MTRLEIPADAPWQLHDPQVQKHLMLWALTPARGHLWAVYYNADVKADWREYINGECSFFDGYVSYAEWVGVVPHRHDNALVWC